MDILLTYIPQTEGVDSISVMLTFLFFMAFAIGWAVNRISLLRIRRKAKGIKELSTIMQHTLNTGNNYVLRLSYYEQYGKNMHGDFLPPEGMSYQESLEFIHPDDRSKYKDFLLRLVNGAKVSECTFRWDKSFSKHEGNWRYMRDVGIAEYADPNAKLPVNFFCTLTDITEKIQLEKEEQEMTDRHKRMFDQSLVGLAFYDEEGHLKGANQKMREILKFQSEDDPYYYGKTIYELPTFRDLLHDNQAEELYLCTKSVVIERGVNCYTELRVHPILDENGQLGMITFSIRDITQERELYLQNRENEKTIQKTNEEIQRYENELQYLMDNVNMRFFRTDFEKREVIFYKSMSAPESRMDFEELIAHFIDDPFADGLRDPYNFFKEQKSTLTHMRPFFHKDQELQWNFIDSIPYYDDKGQQVGTYGVVRNVTDLISKQERLKEETERANQSGLRKSTFMANMTHEIRTPLNAIVGFSDVLPLMSTPEEKQEIIRVIMNNCDMLLRLVNDILAVSSLENKGIEILPSKIDFATVFNDIATSLSQRVQAPGVQFLKDNPYDSFVTILDSGRIQQVVTNFVTNAVKYTQQGHIKIGYRRESRHDRNGLFIYCEDTGTGIPKESQAKVFDRFVKLNDYVQGTGLGLSICKAIADSCQGEIGLFSEGDGTGSTFWIWIPCEEITN